MAENITISSPLRRASVSSRSSPQLKEVVLLLRQRIDASLGDSIDGLAAKALESDSNMSAEQAIQLAIDELHGSEEIDDDQRAAASATLREVVSELTESEKPLDVTSRSETEASTVAVYEALHESDPDKIILEMIKSDEITLAGSDPSLKENVINTLSANSPQSAAAVVNDLSPQQAEDVANELKVLQRTDALATDRQAIPYLMQNQFTSLAVASTSQSAFVAAAKTELETKVATQTHENASSIVVRSNAALMQMFEYIKGSGLAAIDGSESPAARMELVQQKLSEQGVNLNLESLFGSMDQVVIDESTSVYSPAAYFVDLLEYLRHNNLDPAKVSPNLTPSGQADNIEGSALEWLFRRRPDLGDLELSAENTNTSIPYVDIANEVMESFIQHLDTYNKDTSLYKKAKIEAHNVRSETSGELLAQPQHVKSDTYAKLANADYPISLPYNQPIDTQRAFLGFLKINRVDLIETFQPKPSEEIRVAHQAFRTSSESDRLTQLQSIAIDRAVDSERLGLTQEEYRILTGNVFWPKEFVEAQENTTLTDQDYQKKIRVPESYEVWGYKSLSEMNNFDEVKRTGLEFVKQLLHRAEITYLNLIDLLQTDFVNPSRSTGRSKMIFDKFQNYSYFLFWYMMDLNPQKTGSRHEEMFRYLENLRPLVFTEDEGVTKEELQSWAANQFWNAARITSIEARGKATLGARLSVVATNIDASESVPEPSNSWMELRLDPNGSLMDQNNKEWRSGLIGDLYPTGIMLTTRTKERIGCVMSDSSVYHGNPVDMHTLNSQFPNLKFTLMEVKDKPIATIEDGKLYRVGSGDEPKELFSWSVPTNLGDASEIGQARLNTIGSHDGTWEYRLHRFIRLWKKLGWSITDTDRALSGLSPKVQRPVPGAGDFTWPPPRVEAEITPDMISQLAAVTQILPLSQLSVEQLLTFWGPLSYEQPSSLYQRLFLRGIGKLDPVFQKQVGGAFFTDAPQKISDHRLSIKAAFGLSSFQEIDLLLGQGSFKDIAPQVPDVLSMDNLSAIYRRVLLAKVLGVGTIDLPQVVQCFGDPFKDPKTCLDVLRKWKQVISGGFSWVEMRYVCDAVHSPQDPLSPTKTDSLSLSKDISNGILEIQKLHPLIDAPEHATLDLVETKAALFFEQDVVAGISSLISGTTTYTVSVPRIEDRDFPVRVATSLSKERKPRYVLPPASTPGLQQTGSAKLQFQGILTSEEVKKLKAVIEYSPKGLTSLESETDVEASEHSSSDFEFISSNKDQSLRNKWYEAVERARTQANNFYFQHLKGILPKEVGDVLLAADKILQPGSATSQDHGLETADKEGASAGKTVSEKAYEFLQYLVPKIQEKLAHDFIVKTVTSRLGFQHEAIVRVLLDKAIKLKDVNQPAIALLLEQLGRGKEYWHGYFRVDHDRKSKFAVACKDKPEPIVLDGRTLEFQELHSTSEDRWETDEIDFSSGHVHLLHAPISVKRELRLTLAWSKTERINESAFQAWRGFISPASTDSYAFCVVRDQKPEAIRINNELVDFHQIEQDPDVVWMASRDIKLKAGELYPLELRGMLPDQLLWKPHKLSRSRVPDSACFPEFAHRPLYNLVDQLKKLSILLQHVNLTEREISYISENPSQFNGMKFGALEKISQLTYLLDFAQLRGALTPQSDFDMLDLLHWASTTPLAEKADIAKHISWATGWKEEQIEQVLESANFCEGRATEFSDIRVLSRMQKAIKMAKDVKFEIPQLFNWATPLGIGNFDKSEQVANDIQKVAQSRFDLTVWTDAVRPINDILRENRRKALVNYLLVQQPFVSDNNIVDADSLFEYFLIDVNMTPLVQTSRIKQAISSVQLFIQRVLLGLEQKTVPNNALDRNRWEWMQKYRVWEANRKVFLYPENWIEPSLRDTKTEFYKQLEAELLQKDLTPDAVMAALRAYLGSVESVSNLQCIGLYIEPGNTKKLHVFARTQSSPYAYFYNCYRFISDKHGTWKGWESMKVDIPHYEVGSSGFVGNYVAPIVYQGRLLLFTAQLLKTTQSAVSEDLKSGKDNEKPNKYSDLANNEVKGQLPKAGWEIKLGWTEYRNGQWTPRQMCSKAIVDKHLSTEELKKLKDSKASRLAEKTALSGRYGGFAKAYENAREEANKDNTKSANKELGDLIYVDRKMAATTQEINRLEASTAEEDGAAPIDSYSLLPTIVSPTPNSEDATHVLGIKIYITRCLGDSDMELLDGCWVFDGSQLSLEGDIKDRIDLLFPRKWTTFGISLSTEVFRISVRSLQSIETASATTFKGEIRHQPIAQDIGVEDAARWRISTHKALLLSGPVWRRKTSPEEPFYHEIMGDLLRASNTANEPQQLFDGLADATTDWSKFNQAFGNHNELGYDEQRALYSIHGWELGVHAPMALIDRLFKSQQYEQALKACHYIFNPLKSGDNGDLRRFWVFPPFKYMRPGTVEEYLLKLKAANPDPLITNWRNNPMQPHVVARGRPQAYMKWVVMKYIEILIAYGDSLFRQNTLESIPTAIQLYILASHLYGPRGQKVPQRKSQSQRGTYNTLAKDFDPFSNAIVRFEEAFPFKTSTPAPAPDISSMIPFTNVFGSVGTLLFGIPDNPQLRVLAETIDDRLFKIRHSQDINGVFRQLPLFEPPIDPALLVQAAAQGVSISSAIAGLYGPMPNHRFQYLMQKALELAGEVKSLGQALLSNREKLDGEALSVLRAQHDVSTQRTMMEVKKLALDDAAKSVEILEQNRKGVASRLRFYLASVGADVSSGVPEIDRDFIELDAKIEKPIDQGGLALSKYEKEERDKLDTARDLNVDIYWLENAASILYMLPNATVSVQPFGIGMQLTMGPANLAMAASATARGLGYFAEKANYEASMAAWKGHHQRALQERILQANAAGFEIASIDKQITAAKIRIAMTQKEIDTQQQIIDQTNEVYDFLRQKYTNKELYAWIDGATKTLFNNAYSQALDLAIKAQQVYKFERPTVAKTFIEPKYWDASRDGLLSGERLFLALRQLEIAYTSERGHDFEVTKTVSLRRLDPMSLIRLRETGACSFELPEVIFDMDFPGHYMRRIKSVTVTLPCLVGPYTNVNATLRLRTSKYRVNSSLTPQYLEAPDVVADPDSRFISVAVPISAIAVSTAQNDAGVFELNFRDENYMPFEGAGAISTWELELPQIDAFRQFDYDSITDVVMQVRYTSLNGGEAMKRAAIDSVTNYIKANDYVGLSGGLIGIFDIKNDFATAWAKAARASTSGSASSESFAIDLPNLHERLPAYTRQRKPEDITVTSVWVLSDEDLPNVSVKISKDGRDESVSFGDAPTDMGKLKLYQNNAVGKPLEGWKLGFERGPLTAKKCWMLVRYTLR